MKMKALAIINTTNYLAYNLLTFQKKFPQKPYH